MPYTNYTEKLMTRAALKLTGRPVTFRLRDPIVDGAQGSAQKDLAGRNVIDISPWLLDHYGKFVRIFCHELAHVALGHVDTDLGTDITVKPGSIAWSLKGQTFHSMTTNEREAEALAQRWLKLYKPVAPNFGHGVNTNLEAFLLAVIYHEE